MDCPVCKVELRMAERQGVEIDYCPQCRGVWLDRGELDKIIERSVASPPAFQGERTVPTPRSREDDEHHEWEHRDHDHEYEHGYDERYKGKRRKGFLGDLFDF